jgi:hypothetical protein
MCNGLPGKRDYLAKTHSLIERRCLIGRYCSIEGAAPWIKSTA